MVDDVITFVINVIVLGCLWVKMDVKDITNYHFILQLLVEIANIFPSTKYRKFDEEVRKGHESMTDILVINMFNIISSFVKTAKNSHAIQKRKANDNMNMNYLKITIMN